MDLNLNAIITSEMVEAGKKDWVETPKFLDPDLYTINRWRNKYGLSLQKAKEMLTKVKASLEE